MRAKATTSARAQAFPKRAGAVAAMLLTVLILPWESSAAKEARARLPSGYRIDARTQVAKGLEHMVLAGPTQRVHVARMDADSGLKLRPTLAGDSVNGSPEVERTSAMCARTRCLVAVNGDFFSLPGTPTGAVVAGGEPVRSARAKRPQLVVDEIGSLTTGSVRFEIILVSSDLERVRLDGVNVPLGQDRTILYTARNGRTTGTPASAFEMSLRFMRKGGRLRIGETSAARIAAAAAGGDAIIPRDGAVLAARGKDAVALRERWKRIQSGEAAREILLRIDATPSVEESLGGRPVLVHGGAIVSIKDASSFATARHPRTIVGWTRAGDVLLVTVDGRQPDHSRGMTLREAADLMVGLGAVEAINLDGGGSTTFVVKGQVVNRPSDRLVRRNGARLIVAAPQRGDRVVGNVERPVAIALAIVPAGSTLAAPDTWRQGAAAIGALATTAPVELSPPTEHDPASNPDAALPAVIVDEVMRVGARDGLIALASLHIGVGVTSLVVVLRGRTRRRSAKGWGLRQLHAARRAARSREVRVRG